MTSLEKWIIFANLQKLLNNVGNLGKIIVATGFELLPKVKKIAQSGHNDGGWLEKLHSPIWRSHNVTKIVSMDHRVFWFATRGQRIKGKQC